MKAISRKWIIYIGVIALAAIAARFARNTYLSRVACSSEMPSTLAMDAVIRSSRNEIDGLRKLWDTRYLPQRLYVIGKIREFWSEKKNLRAELNPLLLECLDSGIQEGVITSIRLICYSSRQDIDSILPFLRDPDPEIRLAAVLGFLTGGRKAYTPYVAALLDDPEPRVRISTAAMLRRWHRQDFGVRWKAGKEKIDEGLESWRQYLQKLPAESEKIEFRTEKTVCLPCHAPDFELPDLDGKIFHLSEVKKPVTMLYLWGKPDHEEMADMHDLAQLREKFPDKFLLLPIAVDAVPQIHLGHEDAAGSGHNKHAFGEHKDEHHEENEDIVSIIRKRWQDYGFGGTCLVDDGSASFRYGCKDTPIIVIMRDGLVKRHLVSTASLPDLSAILEKVMSE